MTVAVHHGDSRDVLKSLLDNSIDSCVTDPPYALVSIGKRFGADGAEPAKAGKSGAYQRASAGFMGQKWDTGETAFDPEFWREVLRVLKPGAHLFAFGGTRSFHRLVCAIEDAGFEIRDQFCWLYASGFPKSHDVSKGIDKAAPETDDAKKWEGWGTAAKPAQEPICLARKPLSESTVARNVLKWGTGAINVDASRIGTDEDQRRPSAGGENGLAGSGTFKIRERRVEDQAQRSGRWPANVCHDGSDEVLAAFPDSDGQSGALTGHEPSETFGNVYSGPKARAPFEMRGDSGSAARFFFSGKADARDRHGSKHPTVKPVALMQWLATMITPPGGTVLDPFAGSGSTGMAAMSGGFDCILIERETQYVADIKKRIAWAEGKGGLHGQEIARHTLDGDDHGPLFSASQPASQPADGTADLRKIRRRIGPIGMTKK